MIETAKKSRNALIVISVLLSALIAAVFTYLARHLEVDDALIYYRYLRNFINGYGLVYNIGERFNGLTSPFYTYISMLLAVLFRSIQISQIVLGGFCLFLTGFAFVVLFRDIISGEILIFGPLLIVSDFYFYTTFGLESTLFLFLILISLNFYRKEQYYALGLSSALLLLARGEALFLIIILAAFHFTEKRKIPNWKVFIVPVVILGSHYLFNYIYYGETLPGTLSAKIGQGKSGLWGTPPVFLHDKKKLLKHFFGTNYLSALILAASCAIGFISAKKNRLAMIFILYFIVYNMFYIFLNIPNYFWYFSYHFLFLYIFVVWGFENIYGYLKKANMGKVRSYLTVFLLFLITLSSQLTFTYTNLKVIGGHSNYQNIGKWINQNTSPNAKIASVEVGTIGWYSNRYIIDILGLVNPYNAKFISERKFDEWLKYYHPDYILGHVPFWSHEVSLKKAMEDETYLPVTNFHFEGYILLRRAVDSDVIK